MNTLLKNTALATAILASSVSFAAAQSGPVDGKGQAGGSAHRAFSGPMSDESGAARGDYSAAAGVETTMPSESYESYRSAELRSNRDAGYETRSVSEPRGYGGSPSMMSEEPAADTTGPQDRR